MAQNITLLGASYSAVPAVTLPKTGGGTARFDDCSVVTASASDVASGKIFVASDGTITTGTSSGGGGGGGSYPWFGTNTIKDYTKTITINLKNDTSWDSWTASTTETSILAAPTTNDFTYAYDRDTDVVTIVTTSTTNYVLKSTATKTLIPISAGRFHCLIYLGLPSSYSDYKNFTVGTQSSYGNLSSARLYYYDSSGTKSVISTPYGAYYSSNPTFSQSASGSTSIISAKRSSISARCNTYYFATARKEDIDSANTNVVITFDVYKTPRENAFMPHIFDGMVTAMNAAPEA